MYLYVVKEQQRKKAHKRPSMLKIGIARNPESRLQGLQTSNPNDLCFVHLVRCKSEQHAREIEKTFHKKLTNFRIRGEWFRGDAVGLFDKLMRRKTQNGRARFLSAATESAPSMWEMI